jgi:hypothetical protein
MVYRLILSLMNRWIYKQSLDILRDGVSGGLYTPTALQSAPIYTAPTHLLTLFSTQISRAYVYRKGKKKHPDAVMYSTSK